MRLEQKTDNRIDIIDGEFLGCFVRDSKSKSCKWSYYPKGVIMLSQRQMEAITELLIKQNKGEK